MPDPHLWTLIEAARREALLDIQSLNPPEPAMINFVLDSPLADAKIAAAIGREFDRQANQIELIASENIVSADVLNAQGTVLTNKYAEGYPGRRYYGGCKHVDEVETLAIERGKALFGAGFVNVQPHSGAQANQAVFLALLQPGNRIMGMSLAHGGHLTHGLSVTISGRWFDIVNYGVHESDQLIDYDELRARALQTRPKLNFGRYVARLRRGRVPADRRNDPEGGERFGFGRIGWPSCRGDRRPRRGAKPLPPFPHLSLEAIAALRRHDADFLEWGSRCS
jgi:hypothetical protein